MELKDFVSQALIQLIDGVKEAQEHADKQGAVVSPWNMFADRKLGCTTK